MAQLLARPDAGLIRRLLTTARKAGVAPTIFLGMRMATTTFVYADADHPDRPTSSVSSPAYTPEDRALMLALEVYEAELCKCGHPTSVAWHSDMDGWFEQRSFKCFACSAGEDKDVVYSHVVNTRPVDRPLPPFVFGKSTSSPD